MEPHEIFIIVIVFLSAGLTMIVQANTPKKPIEYILCSAIWFKEFDKPAHTALNIDSGVVLCGQGHAHIYAV